MLTDYVDMFHDVNVVVIGDIMLDRYIWGSVDRISPEAPVPVLNVDRESYVPGGGANVANNISSLGGNVILCGVIGNDDAGRHLCDMFVKNNIDIDVIQGVLDRPTITKTRVIGNNQQIVRIDREIIEYMSKPVVNNIIDFVDKHSRDIDVVVVSDYGKGLVSRYLMDGIIEIKRKNELPVIVDPCVEHYGWYGEVTSITPNVKEANMFGSGFDVNSKDDVGIEGLGEHILCELCCDSVLITRGKDGMSFMEKGNGAIHLPTIARDVFDVSGAGDTVISVFSMGIGLGIPTRDAMYLANVAAGIVVGEVGTATVTASTLKKVLGEIDG